MWLHFRVLQISTHVHILAKLQYLNGRKGVLIGVLVVCWFFLFISRKFLVQMRKGTVACILRSRRRDVRVYSKDFDRSFHWLWLRDHCKCAQCVDASSGQKLLTSGSALKSASTPVGLARIEANVLFVEWRDHIAKVPLAELGVVTPASKRAQEMRKGQMREAMHEAIRVFFPPVLLVARFSFLFQEPFFDSRPSISYDEFMNDPHGRAWSLRIIHSSGLLFVHDIPQSASVQVTELAKRIAPVMPTFYGMHWDVRDVAGADNVAYTSRQLGWHQDLLYFESPPGLQLLHCREAAVVGGETMFLDAVAAANVFEQEFPEDFALLSKLHITFQYSNSTVSLSQRRPVFAPATDVYSHRRVFWFVFSDLICCSSSCCCFLQVSRLARHFESASKCESCVRGARLLGGFFGQAECVGCENATGRCRNF
jgi:hypothetical protein